MRVILSGGAFDSSGAASLKKLMTGERSSATVDALLAHLHDLGTRFYVLEDPYTDQDYSADYGAFYAGAFKDHPRFTRRLHFFSQDVSPVLGRSFFDQQKAFDDFDAYLGFVVLRPISSGPVGRTVLPFPTSVGDGLVVRPAARADFDAHLLGTKLHARGCAPFIQQDTRVGACAQAAIWMASRTVFARHKRTAWHSVAEITKLAITPRDAVLSRSLPAGSDGLSPAHIIRAMSGMGHQPLFDFFADETGRAASDAEDPAHTAAASALRYLDSGLPVVLGLGDVMHAVTAVGYVEEAGVAHRPGETYDAFVRALVVHDDQRGPYRLLPLRDVDAARLPPDRLLQAQGKPLTVQDSVTHMFVPLPPRVYLSADDADIVARDYLQSTAERAWPALAQTFEAELGEAKARTTKAFAERIGRGELVRRTYLTSAGRYRHHLARSGMTALGMQEAMLRTLPHFVWVTELISPDTPLTDGAGPRRVLGHVLVNATSSTDPDLDLLFVHVPHAVIHRNINPPPDFEGEVLEELLMLNDDGPYFGRRRR